MREEENKGGPAPGGPIPISGSAGVMTKRTSTGNYPNGACKTYTELDTKLQDRNSVSDEAVRQMMASLSAARMSNHLAVAGGDIRLALRLHHWNAAVAGSLMPTIHIAEIAIRNFALRRISANFGKHWYRDQRFEAKLGRSQLKEALQVSVATLLASGRKGNLADDVTSEMTFGFWVNVFTKTFVPMLWVRPLHTINANIPSQVTISELHDGIEFVRAFRNSVAHHKNLIYRPTPDKFERTLRVIGWVCRSSEVIARGAAQFPLVWQCSPVPHARLCGRNPYQHNMTP